MNKFTIFLRFGLGWGLGAGAACAVYLLVLAVLGQNPFGPLKFIYLSVYGLFFGLAMISLRRKIPYLHFLHALAACLSLNITATLFFHTLLWALISSPVMKEGVEVYKSDLEKYMSDTRTNFIQTEGYQEFMKKYAVREGQIYRGRVLVDSTENQLVETEGNRLFELKHKEKHETFLAQIPHLSAKDIALDQSLGFSFSGLLLSFVFALLFKNAKPNPVFQS
jgi:hypothetical protein